MDTNTPANTATLPTITIDGILYTIKSTSTPEDHDREGRHTSASMMRERNQVAELFLTRPRGRKCFYAIQYASGFISPVVAIAFLNGI